MFKGRGAPLIPLFLIVFINLVGFGIIIPVLPLYAESFSASATTIGLLLASYSLAQMLATPYLGALSDRYGRRPILILSQLGTFISFMMLGFANTLPMVFAARILDGASGGSISTAQAYISDVVEEKNRAKAFGVIGAAFGIGFIAGPAISALLGANGNFTVPIFLAAAISLLSLVLTVILLPESLPADQRGALRTPRILDIAGLREILGMGQLTTLFAIFFAFNLAQAGFQGMFALFALSRFGFGLRETGYFLAYSGLLAALFQGGATGPIVKRWGERNVIRTGLLLAALGLVLSSMVQSWPLLLLALTPLSIGLSLATPALNSMLTRESPAGAYGRILGLSQSVAALARVLGPLLAGLAFAYIGEPSPFILASLLLLGAFAAASMLRRQPIMTMEPAARP